MSIDALTQAWSEALAQISDQLRPATLSFLRSAKPLGDIDGTILIAVPNDFTKKWIENNDATDLTASLTNILGRSVREWSLESLRPCSGFCGLGNSRSRLQPPLYSR